LRVAASKEVKWLLAPKSGPFKMAMWLYTRKKEETTGSWVPAAAVRQK
jgi:hypothetical protein